MNPVKCPNCRLSLPQNWAGMNDPNAKCPYCGKVLASQPAAPSAPAPAPAPPAPAPARPAKTMLWGVGAPIPGVPLPKTVPEIAPKQGSAPSPTSTREAFATAATQSREAIAHQGGAAAASPPASEGAGVDVDMDEPADPVPASPIPLTASKLNQPAATVMFESAAPPMDSSLARMERFAPESESTGSDESAEVAEPEPPEESSPRPTPTKAKPKSKSMAKKGYKAKSSKPAKWSTSEDDAEEPPPPSSKTPIIVVAAVALVALIGAGVYFLRGKGSSEGEPAAKEPLRAAEPAPAQPEPTPAEKPSGLAVKPTPAEPAKPAPTAKPAAEKPSHVERTPPAERSEKPSHAEKAPPAEKPERMEKPAHAEKAAVVEKPKAEPATAPEPKTAGGKPSEEDYRRANEAYDRANANLFQGKTAAAIADFNQALKLNPKDPAIHRGLGLAYAQSGKTADAVKQLKLYLKAAPKATDRAIIEKRIDQLRGH